MVHFFEVVGLDGHFDTPGSFLGYVVGKLWWSESDEFDTKILKT